MLCFLCPCELLQVCKRSVAGKVPVRYVPLLNFFFVGYYAGIYVPHTYVTSLLRVIKRPLHTKNQKRMWYKAINAVVMPANRMCLTASGVSYVCLVLDEHTRIF
jgi:hypothetical protein